MASAGVAARPRAVRLDELPAEVPDEELCWPPLRFTMQWMRPAVYKRWPACAGPTGVRSPTHRAVCNWHGGWTQAFLLRAVCRRALNVDMWKND